MIQNIRTWGLAALGLSLFAALSQAQIQGDAGRLFDGAGRAAGSLPALNFKASAPRHSVQSGADLFYFSPEEAAQADALFGPEALPRARGYVFDKNVPETVAAQMRADLAFIQGIQGGNATPLHRRIFGNADGPSYIEFFETRVTAIGMSSCGNAKAVACVSPYFSPSTMWLTPNFTSFAHPQVSRMMIVFHEARHTETRSGHWPHAYCPSPFKDAHGNDIKSIWTGASLAGEPACDETPFGSYGSSTIMLKNIQKFCANCTDKVKMDAGLYADDQLGRIIDPDAREQMLADLYR